jgi:multiple sugar transport system substrate-binding protein
MNRFFKLMLTLIILVSMSLPVFAQGGSEAAVGEGGKTSITYWHFPFVHSVEGYEEVSEDYGDWEEYLAQEFMKENPDIEVTTELLPWEGGVDKINVSIAGGNPPDLVFDYLGRSGGWYHQGAAVPWNGVASDALLSDIRPSFKDLYTINGDLHAIPGFSWNMNLVVNAGLLKKIGYNKPILNGQGNTFSHREFEQFLTEVKALAGPGVYPLALGAGSEQGDYLWWGFFWGFGAQLFNEDGTVVSESPEMVEGYKWLLKLRDKGLMVPGIASTTTADTMQLWSSGKVVVHGGHKTYYNLIKKGVEDGALDMEVDVRPFPFPSKYGDTGYAAMGPTGFVLLTKDAQKQAATAKFVEFMMQPKYWASQVKGAGQFPATKSVAEMNLYGNDEFQTAVGEMLSKFPAGDFALSNPNYNKIRVALSSCGQAIFAGLKTPEEAVADFLDEVREFER